MALAMGAMIIGGAGLSYYQTLEEGKEAAAEGKRIQEVKEQQAKQAREAGEFGSRQKRKEGTRTMHQRIADVLAHGGSLTGTNLKRLAQVQVEYELDARQISRNFMMQSNTLKYEGALAKYQGSLARRASRIRGFSNFASTMGMAYLMNSGGTNTPSTNIGTGGGSSYYPVPGGYGQNFTPSDYK